MLSESLILLSAPAERALTVTAAVLLAALGLRAAWQGDAGAAMSLDAPVERRVELVLLTLILGLGSAVRLLGWDDGSTPAFWFSEIPQLHIARMLDTGSLGATWTTLLRRYQVGWSHESAVVLPVYALLQRLLGPSFGLPVLVGAVFGIASIVLAWLFGRAVRSQAFGLLFAAFVACSPLQVSWSRLGGFFIAASPHVLLALLCGYLAGRRRSPLLAVASGLVGWTSLYHYYAARVAVPLAGAALWRGCQDSRASWGPRILLAALFAGSIAGVFYGVERGGLRQTFWPSYRGYVGSQGERSLSELATQAMESARTNGREAFADYFFRSRTTNATDGRWHAGVQHGGLCLAPLGILGAVGVLGALVHWRRGWLWLAMLVAGLALPALSVSTARRLLVMDVAWCALAAHGLLALASLLGRGLARRTGAMLVGGVTAAIALWSAAAVFALGGALPRGAGQPIPFGESGFMDGIACRRCVEAGRDWRRAMGDGAFVVLFDGDIDRENRTSPAGLPAYGKLAALAAGSPGRFVDAYALMSNWDVEPPAPGPMYDRARTDFASVLRERIDGAAPARIIWHFERPTASESWLIRRLVEAGGEPRLFQTPLATASGMLGIQVITTGTAQAAAREVLAGLVRGTTDPEETACVTLTPSGKRTAPFPVLLVAGPPDVAGDEPPPWLLASYHDVEFHGARFTVQAPVAATVETGRGGGARLDIVGQTGRRTLIDLPSWRREERPLPTPFRYGLGCAVRLGDQWWAVEPASGRLGTTQAGDGTGWIPRGRWIGLARGADGTLVLASADQEIAVVDVVERRELARFPATVPPAKRVYTDACTLVAAGPGWIAILNGFDWVLDVYDVRGRPLGRRRMDRAADLGGMQLSAMGYSGPYLGVAAGPLLRTIQVGIDPACLPGAPGG